MKKVLLTGASGFVGQALLRRLKNDGYEVRPAARRPRDSGWVELDLNGKGGVFKSALANVDVVVHTAGRAHVMKDKVADSLAEFRRVNTEGTTNLAREAATGGVSRFVYVSSIKVNGEFTRPGRPFSADDTPAPIDPYAVSKYEAEEALKQVASETEMEFVIVRPPLVYGPGVKANFLSMMRWLQKGIPLPLGAISNKRSLVALDNLVDLIETCIGHPAAPGQTFLAGDGEDLSTTELLRRLGAALGKPARLLPVPSWILKSSAALMGNGDVARRLCASLQLDIGKTCRLLNWTPPMSVGEALREAAQHFRESQVRKIL